MDTSMKRTTLLFLVLGLCFGFNWSKCERGLIDTDREGISTQIVSGISNSVYSLAQLTTSTGGCAAIGMNNEERAQSFYAFNHEKVLEDIAKGGGEYYSSMSRLWDCNDKLNIQSARKKYSTLVKQDINQQYKTLKTVSGCRL